MNAIGVFPSNRVQDVLRRLSDNSAQSEAIKTCFGILAIMSREESNKAVIAKEGMDYILSAMTTHVDKADVQESGCDLLWSLAFNNVTAKDIVAKHGGPSVIVRALKRHTRSPEFLKSACGALSNMCQSKLNQDGISSQGGLQPLVGSIHAHQTNTKLLPFIFDALASLIVNNEENARAVSSLGLIPLIVASLGRHKSMTEVVKSGCHALAILSDVKGQASKIAFAGGVPIILLLLDMHPSYADLHRVAAVVLLRMLQESTHVGREITCNEGVRILLKSLEKGGSQQDTVAAVTHILFTVTNPASPASSMIESQLWTQNDNKMIYTPNSGTKGPSSLPHVSSSENLATPTGHSSNSGVTSTLLGLVAVIAQYTERRDVIRAACRLLNNVSSFNGVVAALDKANILDKLLECAAVHHETRDVIDSTANMIKNLHKRHVPLINTSKPTSLHGLLTVLKSKLLDDDLVVACIDILQKLNEMKNDGTMKKNKDVFDEYKVVYGVEINTVVTTVVCEIIRKTIGLDSGSDINNETALTVVNNSPSHVKKGIWIKTTHRTLMTLLTMLESIMGENYTLLKYDSKNGTDVNSILKMLSEYSPVKSNPELLGKIDKLLLILDTARYQQSGGSNNSSSTKSLVEVLRDDCTITSKPTSTVKDEENTSLLSNKVSLVSRTTTKPVKVTESPAGAGTRITKGGGISASETHIGWVADDTEEMESKRVQPKHPLKYYRKSDNDPPPRLLECWPNFLERLNNTSANPIANRGFSSLVGSERMHLCYESSSAAGRGLHSRVLAPVPYMVPTNGIGEPFEHSLTFDSEFESGNLHRAVQRGDANYDLFLRSDLHTPGHTQWFYFAVSNTHPAPLVRLAEQGVQVPPVRVRFNIVNLTKPDSLFNMGMKPVVYSVQDAATKGAGWLRSGNDISYYANSYARNNNAGEGFACYFTLSFTIEFHHAKDTVLIAYSYPYTVSDYKAHLGNYY